jgi:hypothetical protein
MTTRSATACIDLFHVGQQGADGLGQADGIVLGDVHLHLQLLAVLQPQVNRGGAGLHAHHDQVTRADVGDLEHLATTDGHA